LNDLPVILFPHTHISGTDLKKLFPFFGLITICRPWFVDAPAQLTEKGDFPPINVQYPPETLKPKKDFKRVLAEYQLWIKQNQDKGYAASLSFSRQTDQSEETPWEIRQMIQQAGKNLSDPDEHKAFRWHIILHLAREFEESQSEADKLLDKVRHQKPPLDEALEERPVLKNLLDDLPRFEKYSSAPEHHLAHLFEAWLGLFGQYLTDYKLLITFDLNVMGYLTDTTHLAEARFNLPDLSHLPLKDLQEAKGRYSNGSFGKALRSLIKAVERQPGPQRDELQRLLKTIEESVLPELTSGQINVSLKYLSRIPDNDNTLPAVLSGKTLILLEPN
jgi:hypothetical protein